MSKKNIRGHNYRSDNYKMKVFARKVFFCHKNIIFGSVPNNILCFKVVIKNSIFNKIV